MFRDQQTWKEIGVGNMCLLRLGGARWLPASGNTGVSNEGELSRNRPQVAAVASAVVGKRPWPVAESRTFGDTPRSASSTSHGGHQSSQGGHQSSQGGTCTHYASPMETRIHLRSPDAQLSAAPTQLFYCHFVMSAMQRHTVLVKVPSIWITHDLSVIEAVPFIEMIGTTQGVMVLFPWEQRRLPPYSISCVWEWPCVWGWFLCYFSLSVLLANT